MAKIASWSALLAGTILGMMAIGTPARADDPFIRDASSDTGAEPNSGASTTSSPDIWVRRSPDSNYNPAPFDAANPSWTPRPNQAARYSDPRLGRPNWVYVRVRNAGPGATPADARLKLYWSKSGGKMTWPTSWNDYFPAKTPTLLHGMEITKPRRNAATVSQAERDAYVQAILAADTEGFPDGVSFWDKQNEIHSNGIVMPAAHVNPAFLPWHREFLNRYEALLQTSNPTLKLLYWDWQQDPREPINGFSYFSPDFMGAIGQGTTTPIGAPFGPLMSEVEVVRNGRAPDETFGVRPDGPVLALTRYNDVSGSSGLRTIIESGVRHNRAHVDVGGRQPSSCAIDPSTCVMSLSYVAQSVRDPFFFLLHGNVDRLWAQWQRADPQRHDSRTGATPYGLDSVNVNITRTMPPWDGSVGMAPWTSGSPEVRVKTSLDPSVVSPPIYDIAPLTIPVLQAGEAAVLQIPWYPPNPQSYSGSSNSGFELLARIETSTTPPFGMTTPEVSNVATNVSNNNNIARRSITVQNGTTLARVAAPAAAASRAVAGRAAEPGSANPAQAIAAGDELAQADTTETTDDTGSLVISTGGGSAGVVPAEQPSPEAPQLVRPGTRVTIASPDLGDPALIGSVTLLVDGKAVETRRKPPFAFQWQSRRVGGHDVQLQVTDKTGVVSTISRVVTVAENLPPTALLTAPADQAMFRVGDPIAVQAEASDPDGKVARVDFYLSSMAIFADPVIIASVRKPPYAAKLKSPGEGMWMLSAVAVDDKGVQSQSVPIHFMVHAAARGMKH